MIIKNIVKLQGLVLYEVADTLPFKIHY